MIALKNNIHWEHQVATYDITRHSDTDKLKEQINAKVGSTGRMRLCRNEATHIFFISTTIIIISIY